MNTFKETDLASDEKEKKVEDSRNLSKEKNISLLPRGLKSTTLASSEEIKTLEEKIIDYFVQLKKERCFVVVDTQITSFCPSPPKIKKALENLEKQGRIVKINRGWSLK